MIKIVNDVSMNPSSFLKFAKPKSQILVSSLYTKMCVKISLLVIKNTTMWNVESDNWVLNSFALIESD